MASIRCTSFRKSCTHGPRVSTQQQGQPNETEHTGQATACEAGAGEGEGLRTRIKPNKQKHGQLHPPRRTLYHKDAKLKEEKVL